jgi:copper chaperone
MIAFEVKDMSCGHCVGTITKAVTALDGGAKLRSRSSPSRPAPRSSRPRSPRPATRRCGSTPPRTAELPAADSHNSSRTPQRIRAML